MTRTPDRSAVEVNARLEADPAYVAVRDAREREREARLEGERRASAPLLSDLAAIGFTVESVWDLLSDSRPYTQALPVLLEHLERGGYPPRVMEAIGRALAVKPAVRYWDRLMAAYERAEDEGAREGIAVALDACATRQQIADLMNLVRKRRGGDDSYLYFLARIMKLGGPEGRELIESLIADPVLGKEATALTKRARKKVDGRTKD
jgi:hypothetical protein